MMATLFIHETVKELLRIVLL